MKKLLFVNTHWSNRGDEAAFRPLLNTVLTQCPDWKVEVMFKDKRDVQGFSYPNVDYFSFEERPNTNPEALMLLVCEKSKSISMREAIKRMASADAIIYSPGGAVICDRFWFTKQTEYLLPFVVAKQHNIPIMVAAPSIGPFDQNKKWQNILIKHYLRTARPLIVREPISEQYLKSIGVESKVTIDSAFLDDADNQSCAEILQKDKKLNAFLSSQKVIAMTVTDFKWHVKYMKDKSAQDSIRTAITETISYLQGGGVRYTFHPSAIWKPKRHRVHCTICE